MYHLETSVVQYVPNVPEFFPPNSPVSVFKINIYENMFRPIFTNSYLEQSY